ncbi:NADPH:adrenodoxin oxidoreductase, mitochondrial-like [Neltuma alba]|uniref:NADPH:adrenodoxin oxidoreductase, mitochondrial-like n=1 Tax=Neltuma alba TaxID=207710 RepID=UPI0010A3EE6C|nr:NADPH:adrenodoxin oxidoreductase, mitochondrial-like [Prosopis alba]
MFDLGLEDLLIDEEEWNLVFYRRIRIGKVKATLKKMDNGKAIGPNISGIVPNNEGRVLSDASGDSTLLEEGLYVCGWLKRGPTGIIATNLYCAEETVSSISEDLNKGVLVPSSILPKQGRDGLRQLLHDRNVRIVSFSDWEKIDTEEKRRGITVNKPREKLATWEELLKTASG